MAMTATTNTSANTALRYLGINNAASASSLAKLSSGSRIVRASDDAASLAVGTKLKADVTALKQAQVNASQASSLLQVADGALAQTVDILMRMKALSVQAQSGSVSDNERGFLDKEFQALSAQIDSIADQTKFNGEKLLDGALATTSAVDDFSGLTTGTFDVMLGGGAPAGVYQIAVDDTANTMTLTNTTTGIAQTVDVTDGATLTGEVRFSQFDITLDVDAFTMADVTAGATTQFTVTSNAMNFQVGVSSTDTIGVNLQSIETATLGGANIADQDGTLATRTLDDFDGTGAAANVSNQDNAITAGNILDRAIAQLNEYRADVGSLISRFDFASANLATTVENLDAARSVLLDVDMAAEMSNFSSKQVLLQASVAMLAQANQQPQQLLKLLG